MIDYKNEGLYEVTHVVETDTGVKQPGWYFGTEDEDFEGPYRTREEAVTAQTRYFQETKCSCVGVRG